MKRKFKLFATVASLCLAVALMAFGVYAASKVDYNLNGSVTYEVKDVYVTITTAVDYYTGSTDGYANAEAVNAVSSDDAWTSVSGVPGVFNNGNQPEAENASGKTDYLPAFDFNTSTLYRVTVKVVSRNQDKAIVVTPTIEAKGVEASQGGGVGSAATNITVVNATQSTIEAEGTQDYIFYVALQDATLASTGTFQIVLSIEQDKTGE